MKNVKALNLKNMKETYVNYSGTQDEMDMIWNGFYRMACIGFISRDTWTKFYDKCKGWYIDENLACVRDSANEDEIVWAYTPDAEYKA